MPMGPSARKIHRERDEKADRRRRNRRRRPYGLVGLGTGLPTPAVPLRQRGSRSGGFPIHLTDVLDLSRGPRAVLDGVVHRLVPRQGQAGRSHHRTISWDAHAIGAFVEDINHTVSCRWSQLMAWTRGVSPAAPYARLDQQAINVRPSDQAAIEDFLGTRLIPLLQATAGHVEPSHVEISPVAVSRRDRSIGLPAGMHRWFAMAGGEWHELVPFFGDIPSDRMSVIVGDECFVAVQSGLPEPAATIYSRALMEAITQVLPSTAGRQDESELYRDETYAVIRTPGGHYCLCQQLSAYAVEDKDGSLYMFDPVEIAIQISGIRPFEVLHDGVIRTVRPYAHMFVSRIGECFVVCMPTADDCYQRLHNLPLERALLAHMEAARLTLCAGYSWHNSDGHPVGVLGRPRVNAGDVTAQGLPVYRYQHYRNHRQDRN